MNRLKHTFTSLFLCCLLVLPAAGAFVSSVNAQPAKTATAKDGNGKQEGKEETPAKQEPTRAREGVWTLLVKGGWTMVPLGLITTIIIAFAIERGFYFRRQKVETKGYFRQLESTLAAGGLPEAEKFLAEDPRLISRILTRALERKNDGFEAVERAVELNASVEVGNLERGLNLLANMGNLAPLLGFFGTVVGMRASFLQFVEKAAPTAQDLAAGVEEALITTAAGLLIAIPTYLVHNLFIYAIDSVTIELERSATAIINRLRS